MKQIRILVTGAGGAPGANFIDSLRLIKERQFYIVGADVNKFHLELNSQLDKKYIIPTVDSPDYIEILNKVIDKEKIQFVHCQPEQEVSFLSRNKDRLHANTLFPSPEILDITNNKDTLNKILKKEKISVPLAFHIKDKKSLELALARLLKDYPKAWLRATHGAGSRASLPVYNLKQAEGWIDYWRSFKGLSYSDFMLSEFLPGKEFAFQSIWYEGELITSMARERVEYLFGNLFPSGQSSSPSIAKTVHREDINELATKAILSVDRRATGIFCADIKENRKGVACLTEINAGRFFTTSNNFSHAGCNMPYYYILLGLGLKKDLPKMKKYNAIPADWYWVRLMDMGYKLIKNNTWSSTQI